MAPLRAPTAPRTRCRAPRSDCRKTHPASGVVRGGDDFVTVSRCQRRGHAASSSSRTRRTGTSGISRYGAREWRRRTRSSATRSNCSPVKAGRATPRSQRPAFACAGTDGGRAGCCGRSRSTTATAPLPTCSAPSCSSTKHATAHDACFPNRTRSSSSRLRDIDPALVAAMAGSGRWLVNQFPQSGFLAAVPPDDRAGGVHAVGRRGEARRRAHGGCVRVAVGAPTRDAYGLATRGAVPRLDGGAHRRHASSRAGPPDARRQLGLPSEAKVALLFGDGNNKQREVVLDAFASLDGWTLVMEARWPMTSTRRTPAVRTAFPASFPTCGVTCCTRLRNSWCSASGPATATTRHADGCDLGRRAGGVLRRHERRRGRHPVHASGPCSPPATPRSPTPSVGARQIAPADLAAACQEHSTAFLGAAALLDPADFST